MREWGTVSVAFQWNIQSSSALWGSWCHSCRNSQKVVNFGKLFLCWFSSNTSQIGGRGGATKHLRVLSVHFVPPSLSEMCSCFTPAVPAIRLICLIYHEKLLEKSWALLGNYCTFHNGPAQRIKITCSILITYIGSQKSQSFICSGLISFYGLSFRVFPRKFIQIGGSNRP